jgi:hypothetical protein
MATSGASRTLLLAVSFAASACSWSRFDDLEDGAPVVLLKEPGGVGPGFGSAVAASSTASDANVLVAAARDQRGAAAYRVGFGQNPVIDAIDSGHCRQDCALASSVASLASAATPSGTRSFCWVTGISSFGLIARCSDGQPLPDYALSVPSGVAISPTDRLVLASDHAEAPSLAAATNAGAGRAWFYPPLALGFVELVPPSSDSGFGAALAVAMTPSGRVYAVGAPEANRVWLFSASADGQSVSSSGCVTGGAGFGRTLAAGDVDGVAGDELVVAADDHVEVLRGIDALAQGGGCVPTDSALLTRLECVTTPDLSGCGSGSAFGKSLAVGDLNGDGNGEVLVGAPGMSARGERRAGAVLIYDVDLTGQREPEWLTDAKFISSAESGDALGSSLASVLQRPDTGNPRHVLLAGAPGGDKAAMFYCFNLTSGKHGSRCQ